MNDTVVMIERPTQLKDGAAKRLCILLIAYEFPPIPSPQSLRWAYLSRELALLGHQVHVLAPDHAGYGPTSGLPTLPEAMQVHRTFPGPLAWLVGYGRRRRARREVDRGVGRSSEAASTIELRLNWKGRLIATFARIWEFLLFPDARAEWTPWARLALARMLPSLRPDVVIASHEPASTLPLALMAKSKGFFVAADLGDPVCAPYTKRRWHRRAIRLEKTICHTLDLVTVTSHATLDLLSTRHGVERPHFHLMPQGYEPRRVVQLSESDRRDNMFSADCLELFYAGSFYDFRSPSALVDAVASIPGVRLTVASQAVPDDMIKAAENHPASFRLLGFIAHDHVLRLQAQADILVNIANANPTQVPGKIYEYLGSGRPILHIGDAQDAASRLIDVTQRGWTTSNSFESIRQVLQQCVKNKDAIRERRLEDRLDIRKYAWAALAGNLSHRLVAELERLRIDGKQKHDG